MNFLFVILYFMKNIYMSKIKTYSSGKKMHFDFDWICVELEPFKVHLGHGGLKAKIKNIDWLLRRWTNF